MKKKWIAIAALLLVSAGSAWAQSATDSFSVSARNIGIFQFDIVGTTFDFGDVDSDGNTSTTGVTGARNGADNGAVYTQAAATTFTCSSAPSRTVRVFFRYSVNTPDDFTHLRSMIYLSSHPEVEAGMNQVLVVARMGVPLYVENIKAAAANLTIHELAWDRPEETPDRLRLRLLVTNDGERNIRPKGFVHLRSDDGRFDETFDFNEGREPVLPGQTRLWEQYFGPVPEGQLSARLRFETSPRNTHRADSVIPAFEG